LTKLVSNVGFLKELVAFVNESFNGIVHECPYQGKFAIVNASFGENTKAMEKMILIQHFPNGMYKLHAHVFRKKDDNIGTMALFFEVKRRVNIINQDEEF
jgi:hypothetical protein